MGKVDMSGKTPGTNMYGCLPCPKCGEPFRAAFKHGQGGGYVIECDDCGFVEDAEFAEGSEPDKGGA